MSKELIIYKLANKYNLPIKKIQEITNYQFKYVSNIIKEGNFDSIRLPYFGKFSANKYRIKYIQELKKKKNEKDTL
jgi:nucleoid DNA-binding protein